MYSLNLKPKPTSSTIRMAYCFTSSLFQNHLYFSVWWQIKWFDQCADVQSWWFVEQHQIPIPNTNFCMWYNVYLCRCDSDNWWDNKFKIWWFEKIHYLRLVLNRCLLLKQILILTSLRSHQTVSIFWNCNFIIPG